MNIANIALMNKTLVKDKGKLNTKNNNEKNDFAKILDNNMGKFEGKEKISNDEINGKDDSKTPITDVSATKKQSGNELHEIENKDATKINELDEKESLKGNEEKDDKVQLDAFLAMLSQLIDLQENEGMDKEIIDGQKVISIDNETKVYIEEMIKPILKNSENISKNEVNKAIELIENILSGKVIDDKELNKLIRNDLVLENVDQLNANMKQDNHEFLDLAKRYIDNESLSQMKVYDKGNLEAAEEDAINYQNRHSNNEVTLIEGIENSTIKNSSIINVNSKITNGETVLETSEDNAIEFFETVMNNAEIDGSTKFINKNSLLERTVVLNKDEIFTKIIEESRIINEGETSEIRIRLKPDSLGKLTIRLVMENGEMSAKFIANNYKAKETIESSFTELKDVLSEKGITIQDLSVSVGNESKWQHNSQFDGSWNKRERLSRANISDEKILEERLLINENPYSLSESYLDIRI